jgi:NAD(P)H-nitrite reductase large subunit
MSVTRCVCYQGTFAELKRLCEAHGWTTVGEISFETRCGLGCGACRPYLTAMLDTGATSFAVAEAGQKPQPTTPEPWEVSC